MSSPDRPLRLIAAGLLFLGTACVDNGASRPAPTKAATAISTPVPTPTVESITGFTTVKCRGGEITIPKPAGWNFLEVSLTPDWTNCYISAGQITREEDFRNGLRVSRLVVPVSEQDRLAYARQLTSKPDDRGWLPQGGTASETRKGSLRVFSGEFTGRNGNVLSREIRRVYLADGSAVVIIAVFTAPMPTAEQDFRNFGRLMLEGIQIKIIPKGNKTA